jgi:hypothetical protein
MVMEPEALTLAMVSLDCAKALLARIVETASASNCFFMAVSGWVEISKRVFNNKKSVF